MEKKFIDIKIVSLIDMTSPSAQLLIRELIFKAKKK